MTPFHAIVAEANALGLRVNNCFQLREGWQANLRSEKVGEPDADGVQVFGRGDSPEGALSQALDLAKKCLASNKRSAAARSSPVTTLGVTLDELNSDLEKTSYAKPTQIDLEEAIAAAPAPDDSDLF